MSRHVIFQEIFNSHITAQSVFEQEIKRFSYDRCHVGIFYIRQLFRIEALFVPNLCANIQGFSVLFIISANNFDDVLNFSVHTEAVRKE